MTKKTRKPAQHPGPDSSAHRDDWPKEAGVPMGHYYASRQQDLESRKRLGRASKVQGVDQELAVLRWRLDELLVQEDKNDPLILKTIELIVRAYAAKSRSSGDSSAPTEEGIERILRDASTKLGLERIPWDSNC